ncbi:MAG: S8 family serine peptidase [Myxococcales bacterium]|nr:S8 family serine peptidase [Myxococcales bacterium]
MSAGLAGPALAQTAPPPGPERPAVDYRDGDQPRAARRLGPAGDRTAVEVAVPDGRRFPAEIDAHALVRLTPQADADATFAALGLTPVRRVHRRERIWQVTGHPGEDGLAVAARLMDAPGVANATPDLWLAHTRHAIDIPPDDPRYDGQWYLERITIEDAWALSTGAPEVNITIIDGGCQTEHPDLVAKMDPGYDAADDDADPNPDIGYPGDNHGTSVAGVAAASTDNGVGVAGACPECRLRCVRLLPEDGGPVALSADVAAFDFALEQGAWVVNNSWGFTNPMPAPADLARAIQRVATEGREGKGALVVFAVGNDSRRLGNDELPGLPGVLGVGATNLRNELTQFSNSGRAVDVVAPTGTLAPDLVGADGDDPGDYTVHFGGTSSAAPVVSGLAGLLLAAAPDRTSQAIHDALTDTAQQSLFAAELAADGHDPEYGFGVVRPAHALRALLGLPEPGEEPDAGPPDAALGDQGLADGAVGDGGLADASAADGGPQNAKPAATSDGCEASGGPGGWGALLLIPWALGRRRRRRPD